MGEQEAPSTATGPMDLGALNLEHWSVGMERALAFRDRGNDHRFYDITEDLALLVFFAPAHSGEP